MRRGADASSLLPEQAAEVLDENQPANPQPKARRAGLGVRAAGPLADLTSHSR